MTPTVHTVTQEQYDLLCDARKRFAELDEQMQIDQGQGFMSFELSRKIPACGCFGAWLEYWYGKKMLACLPDISSYESPSRYENAMRIYENLSCYEKAMHTFETLFGIEPWVLDHYAFTELFDVGEGYDPNAFGINNWDAPPSKVLGRPSSLNVMLRKRHERHCNIPVGSDGYQRNRYRAAPGQGS